MKKVFGMLLTVCMALTLTSCTVDNAGDTQSKPSLETPTPTQTPNITPSATPSEALEKASEPDTPTKPPFEGKIAIISLAADERVHTIPPVIDKYGEDKVIYVTWPAVYMSEQEEMINIVTELGAAPDIKGIIVNQAVPGTDDAFEKLRETRKDIFVVYCEPAYDFASVDEMTQMADMVLMTDELSTGSAMVQQAYKLGAKTFVHYSFPSHMSYPINLEKRDRIENECENLGIEFIDATALDPTSDVGSARAQQWILDDVPNKDNIYQILCGKVKSKPKDQPTFTFRKGVYEKYFRPDQPAKEVQRIMEKALELYFRHE